jgi:DNA-binding CsgD family transcriptional regulator
VASALAIHVERKLTGCGKTSATLQPLNVSREQEFGRMKGRGSGVRSTALFGIDSLTHSEFVALEYLAAGLTRGEIAARMRLSPHTVSHHLTIAKEKLGARSLVQAAASLVLLSHNPQVSWFDEVGRPRQVDDETVSRRQTDTTR